jgi:tRNA (guanine37-N1)-methyltransferase
MKSQKVKNYSVITLFPEAIEPYFNSSMLKRAQEVLKPKGSKKGRKAVISISCVNPRKFTKDKHKRVDQKPYAGGPGMVLSAEPILTAVESAIKKSKVVNTKKKTEVIFLTPSGEPFNAAMAKELAQKDHLIFICGRYEGVDERVPQILKARKVSLGDFVVTGGELPAAMMIDAIARYVPGVLGSEESREDERIASPESYTRPEVLVWKRKKYSVPEVLLSGDHKKIEAWRAQKRQKQS